MGEEILSVCMSQERTAHLEGLIAAAKTLKRYGSVLPSDLKS
jgi:hypothetical protein